jgi:magnesium chelatase subunit H
MVHAHAHASFGASRAAASRASATLDRRRHRHRCAPARAIERDVREGKLVSDAEDFSTNVLVASAGAAGADVESVRVNEEDVAQAEETARALRASVEALTAELDACYRATFGSITLVVDEGGASASAESGRRFEDMTETAFRTLNASEPATAAALLKEAEKDIATWLSFQKNVHSIKARRDRTRDSLAEAENALAVAKRGGVGFLTAPAPMKTGTVEQREGTRKIVLLSGFESFNVALYKASARDLKKRYPHVDLLVFSDRDIEGRREELEAALDGADVFFGSLLFDYDQVEWLRSRIADIPLRFVFESALELMSCTSVGSFQMAAPSGQKAGPPPAVKAVLAKFGSGKEEDKLVGYLSFLKIGPQLLKFVPGDKAKDLKNWLTVYAYWNQGGKENVEEAFAYLAAEYLAPLGEEKKDTNFLAKIFGLGGAKGPKPPKETPALGLYHPQLEREKRPYFESVSAYLDWHARTRAHKVPVDAPRVAVLLYRKHVITKQPYLADLVESFEDSGVLPIPIFINGVEAHTIVRDMLTSDYEQKRRASGVIEVDSLKSDATIVDAVVSTVGFPLVGGPAGSMEAGRQAEVAQGILGAKNIPYFVAAPLLIQDIASWVQSGVGGLQSTILYALPELDGAIDTVALGGLCGDNIYLTRERVFALANRLKQWRNLRTSARDERKIAVMLYGFPPGVGATGTAALLNVPDSLENMLNSLREQGYNLGDQDELPSGEAIVRALRALEENATIMAGYDGAVDAVNALKETGDLPGVEVAGANVSPAQLKKWLAFPKSWGPTEWGPIPFLPEPDILVRKMEAAWGPLENYLGLATAPGKGSVVTGLRLGNVFIGIQPALGVEGDPMRLLFERDLTPHPQYAAYYKWLQNDFNASAVVHFGMHGTVEWLPGSPLGNTGLSWSEQLLGAMPNVYVYAANNPSESIIAKRRGYGVIISHNVPPYGRAGLYKQTAQLRELLNEYRENPSENAALRGTIFDVVVAAGLDSDCPYVAADADASEPLPRMTPELADSLSQDAFDAYVSELYTYLGVLENRLFSEGLHALGKPPTERSMAQYLNAYFDGDVSEDIIDVIVKASPDEGMDAIKARLEKTFNLQVPADARDAMSSDDATATVGDKVIEAVEIRDLLAMNSQEITGMHRALDGEWVPPAVGGDLLRDGKGVLPTGRNIHALDPYRMPSAAAEARGAAVADGILKQHQDANDGAYPETVSVNLWGLDAIKTKGESVGIVLRLVGARAVKEGTGRVARYELIPLSELNGRPRVDVLCNMSGIFRDSFANVVGLLDDLFVRAAEADEPDDLNFIRKHSREMSSNGLENSTARLFSNPPGDYGSMVNERVGTSGWEDSRELGDTWASRNAYSYGKGAERGTARPEVLQSLLRTTERVVQEIDSVEYGLTDIQEYYANTGALVAAAKAAKEDAGVVNPKVACSIVETFGKDVTPKDLDETLRMEYRTKLLNPRWATAMADQGSGGAYEISQRMTALVGWGATSGFAENWVYDGANETYVEDEIMREKLRKSNPQAFRNVIKRMLEAAGRGMWDADEETLSKLRELYSDIEDEMEGVTLAKSAKRT